MILSHLAHGPVLHVAANMRAIDREEIYGLRFDENPFLIVNQVMAFPQYGWVVWRDEKPAAVIGAVERHPGCWQVYCFGTDDFPRVALPLTRFVKTQFVPRLFEDCGARRLEADSLWKHEEAHRWLKGFGAVHEGTKRGYGKNGDDYFTFALCRI